MSYITQLLDQRRQPDVLGGLMMGAGGLAGGLAQFQAQEQERKRLEAERLRKAAQERYQGLQEAGKGLMLAGQGEQAAKLIPAVRGAFNEAYGQNLGVPGISGEPVMARGQEMVNGKMTPTPYTYDTGKRDFDNPRTAAGIRAGLMLGAPKLDDRDPYRELYDTETGGVVRAAKDNPYKMTAEVQEELRRLGYSTSAANNMRNNETRVYVVGQQQAGADGRLADTLETREKLFNLGEQGKDRRQRTAADIAAERRQKALEDKEIAERARAAAIAGRYVTSKLGGVAKVHKETADIEFDGLYPMTAKQRRMLENIAVDVGGLFYEEPGKKPRIIMNPGSTAASLRDKIKDPVLVEGPDSTWVPKVEGGKVKPRLVTDKTTGKRVADGAGVTVDDPEGKLALNESRHNQALWNKALAKALAAETADARADFRAIDQVRVKQLAEEYYDMAIQAGAAGRETQPGAPAPTAAEDPAAELLRMMREEREARKKK